MAHCFGGVPTYRTIYTVNTVKKRRYTMKKITNPVKLRNALNISDSEDHLKIREMLVDKPEESD